MKKLDRYTEYCLLVSSLDAKSEELLKAISLQGKLKYEVQTIKKKLEEYSDVSLLSTEETDAIKRIRMKNCLNSVEYFDEGGSVSRSPIESFISSDEYKRFNEDQKNLFNSVHPQLSDNQYSIKNAIIISNDDGSDLDIYESSVIEDFIDEIMKNSDAYKYLSVKELKEMKKIIYIFVEHTSKFE
jgi:hypothetical protein